MRNRKAPQKLPPRTRHRIKGKDKRFGVETYYGTFDSLDECLTHMERLNRMLGNVVEFEKEDIVE